MENTSEKKDKNSVKKPLKHICIGLVAHVDAGKTTLSEGMLYLSGQIRNMGRVDHGDTFLDSYETERERGLTIFSKQAEFIWNDTSITILDTPGHVDFSAEMERVLQVLDCAVLVVSAVDGVQAHTVTLWRLLKQYKIPTMIFVNKMDRQEADREKLLEELKTDSETAVWRWTCSRRRTEKVLRCVMRQCLRNIYQAGRSKRRL